MEALIFTVEFPRQFCILNCLVFGIALPSPSGTDEGLCWIKLTGCRILIMQEDRKKTRQCAV